MAGLLPFDNPFSQWVDPRRNALMGFSAGMLAGDPSQAMLGAMQGSGIDQQRAAEAAQQAQAEQERNATLEWVKQNAPQFANLPPAMAFEAAMKQLQQAQGGPNQFQERFQAGQQYGLTGADLNTFALTGSVPGTSRSNVTYATTPIWGVDPVTEQQVYGVQGSDGSFLQVNTPGFQPLAPADIAASKATGTGDAKTAAAARAALPGAQQMKTITDQAISGVTANQKGMDEWFNQWGPRGLYVQPGSEMGKFIAAAAPTNAQAFMQAREMLKGGGQITDYEGRRAEDAISRMQAALDNGSKEQYVQAVADFKAAVEDGYQKLLATAQGGYAAGQTPSPSVPPGVAPATPAPLPAAPASPAPAAAPSPPPAIPASGATYVYNPATGKLELRP